MNYNEIRYYDTFGGVTQNLADFAAGREGVKRLAALGKEIFPRRRHERSFHSTRAVLFAGAT